MIGWLKRLFLGAAWRLYQIALMGGGAMLFYWIFDIHSDTESNFIALWMIAAFVFAYFFTWGITILTRRTLDGLYRAFDNHALGQRADGRGREPASPERLHRLGVGEKPDDYISLSPSSRNHLR